MTLAQRLLLAIAAVTIATAAVAGFAVRKAWRDTEEARFEAAYRAALQSSGRLLASEVESLALSVEPLCRNEPTVDRALVGLRSRDLDARRLSLSLQVADLAKARKLDELLLVTGAGEVLGSHTPGEVGRRDPALARRIVQGGSARVRDAPPLAVEFTCRRGEGERDWVGLYAARHIDALLASIGASFDVTLGRESPPANANVLGEPLSVPGLSGVRIWASRSRVPVLAALRELDATLFGIGLSALAGALVLAVLLSRGLARPIVELSRQAREIVHGDPKPVAKGGGREIEELADAFNRAIADLVQLRRRLAAAERIAARREMARLVAHEIKNPLAPIRAAIETLRRLRARSDPAFDEYFDEATRTVLDEVARISNIVNDFTRFARLPPPRPAPMDLAETARSVVSLHAKSGAPVVLEGDPAVPVVADRDQVVQVLTNLVQNALDAVKETPSPRVVVEVKNDGELARLAVTDNGPGFSPAVREHLFEPYLTTKPDGTGLGLAIVQRIVFEHGGEIALAEAPGPGASLLIELPVAGPPSVPEQGNAYERTEK